LLASPDLGGDSTTLDVMARLKPAFAFFAAGLFDTTAFHFLIVTCEASEPGRDGEHIAPPSALEPYSNSHYLGYLPYREHHIVLA
jgi:hypothetical protein